MGGVAVRVRDRGPGVDPLEAQDIFDPFYRSASTAKMAGGAGIGLYVSRRLVEAMGGQIWATPRPAGGSEFTFVLPTYAGDPGDGDGANAPTATRAATLRATDGDGRSRVGDVGL
jgi:signal transduction histidine kinase